MNATTEQNRKIVTRFNKEFVEGGNINCFHELIAADCINHSAPLGSSKGPDGMLYFLQQILKKGFPDITVEILEQVAEGDLVTSRKKLTATHGGEFMGIPATHKKVEIDVIDIIRIRNGKYAEHWGMSNLADIAKQLAD